MILMSAALGYASYYTSRSAIAELAYQKNTPESVVRAVHLAPGNATYHALLGEYAQGFGAPTEDHLRTAASLNRFDAKYLNRLGFIAEVQQDYPAAETVLLQAAKVDNGFRPRWALMNYYFRRGNSGDFWLWADKTLRRSYGDLTPVFRLCWAQTPDSQPVEKILPNEPDFRLRYLEYLNAEQPPEAATALARVVAAELSPGADADSALVYCSRILEYNSGAALAVWNKLSERRAIPFNNLRPEQGLIITNDDFSLPLDGRGFSWRLRHPDGVHVSSGGNGLTLALDGTQPEIFEILEQALPLAPRKRYRITIDYEITPQTTDSGLRWHVDTMNSRMLAETETLRGEGTERQNLTFDSAGDGAAFLRLTFHRPQGKVRWSGTAILHKISAQVVP